ncbi:molybdenum cofactor synthesis domain-containing protein [Clostridium sp. DSM 8431]|uniref:molybdopterin-binding protein n=1 Tax=Clostridium sp. DSM 8431 TaxID=1761781 RepID=UPI0008E783C9|nr:molybdopterin-binding protein [Clostridium sp. DSM 8431]SFU57417.1 molybdenum cofactor synthesis domain-containing protein [Clostridium sp. DSM 8431]
MKLIRTEDAVGHVLCHDITRIVKDVVKDTPFRKGHIVKEEDIPVLLSIGKEHLYIWEKKEGILHEDEAAEILKNISINDNMVSSEIREGKIELKADIDGLFIVDVDRLEQINSLDEIAIASRHTNYAVKKGNKLAGMRVIPLVIEEEKLKEAEKIAGDKPLFELLPYKKMKAGVVTTGSEVYHKRIKDTFTPVIINKLKYYGIEVIFHEICDDDTDMIVNAITKMKEEGADLILCTGGMSVDPDDLTPGAIKLSGANIVTYGAPVFPGAMFLLGYFDDGTPIMGLPGCVMYSKATVFDLVLPRVAAGIEVTKKDIAKMGHGGLCFSCEVCTYPRCEFGKGV